MQFIKATGIVSSILALIVVAIALLKQVIAFIGFLTFAIKAVIILVFAALFIGVAALIFLSWNKSKRRNKD